MGMVGAIKTMLGRCWRWSGSPLVVLVCVPALCWHTSFLASSLNGFSTSFGARDAWRAVIRSGSFGGRETSVISESYVYIERSSGQEAHLFDSADWGTNPIIGIDRESVFSSGVWAATRRSKQFRRGIDLFEPGPLNEYGWIQEHDPPLLSDEYFQRGLVATAPLYRKYSDEFNPVIYRAMRSGQFEYTESIYAGYAHNGLALFLLGMTGRGVFGSRRWWRACKARFRSKRNCCVACGYGLEGLTKPRCPECGNGITAVARRKDKCRDQVVASGV